jgi:hypothetical protein
VPVLECNCNRQFKRCAFVIRYFTEYRPASVIKYFTGDTSAVPFFRENYIAKHFLYEIYPYFYPVLFGRQCAFLIPYSIRYMLVFLLISISTYIYIYTGRFIMFSVITKIYNKKTKGPTLMELFTATEKLKKIFLQLEMFTRGAHIENL